MVIKIRLIIFSLCVFFILAQQSPQSIPAIPIQVDQKVPNTIKTAAKHKSQQIIEVQQQSKLQEQLNQQLPVWISEELQQTQSVVELPITETFSFKLDSQEELIFKWDPSKQKELKLIVNVFYLTSKGYVSVIKDAQETEYVEIMAKNPNAVFFGLIGKVYRSKILTVDFDTDYKELKFTNKNSETVLIEIDVEKLQFVVSKGVPDDKLTTARNKMHSILQQSQSTEIQREHVYKWQWGFLENDKNHQMQILGLTGVQLFSILVTACVQMYCLKGLLDNRAVV